MARRRPPPEELPVVFRFRPPAPAPFVDLRGEMTHFQHVSPMAETAPGQFEKTVRLGTGVYAYKLFGGGDTWWPDPENPRTRSRDGARNNVVVIGGTDEPLLHAPARPFLFTTEDGRLCVRAALRRGAAESVAVRWDEGDGPRETGMQIVAEEDEHLLCEAHLPASARAVEYMFSLPNGHLVGRAGAAGQAFRVTRSHTFLETPEWWRNAVVYTVLLDRFRRGEKGTWGPPPEREMARWGGDLDGVTAALPYLADLGITVVHLTPVTPAPSAHRYDAVDPRAVDPALGGAPALTRLLEEAHRRGLRVILDVAATHVDRDFFAFRDVRDRGPRSPYFGWFHVHKYPFTEGIDPGYEHYQKGQWREPLLDTDNPEVVDYLADTFAGWAKLGADGFRVDAAADLPLATIRRFAEAARGVRDDIVLYGEVIPPNIHRFTADALDAATDFAVQESLYDWLFRKRIGASRVALVNARRRFDRGGPGTTALTFTATHDQHRFRTLTEDPRPARLAQLFVLLGAPIPSLLYGDEVGLTPEWTELAPPKTPSTPTSEQGGARQASPFDGAPSPRLRNTPAEPGFEGVWGDRAPMHWPLPGRESAPTWDLETLALVKGALRIRRENKAIHSGDEAFLALAPSAPAGAPGEAAAGTPEDRTGADDVLAIRRSSGDEIIDVILHGGEGYRTVTLPEGAPSGADVLLTLGEAALESAPARASEAQASSASHDSHAHEGSPHDGSPHDSNAHADSPRRVRLGPYAAIVLRRIPPAATVALWNELASQSTLLSGLSFREGSLTSAPLPAHLYVTVTERCNLSCAHCITSAPEKTTSGRARTTSPWLVEALRGPFAAADYIGFVHGGESLVAPVFWDVLRAAERARAGRPGRVDIHVLSNGMLLDEPRVRRLIDHGVTSLSVSLDGATEVTNDTLRKGGRLPTILANLRRTAEIRRETAADLRIGVSTVVTAGNVTELAALGRIVADLGLDWLKVEEIFPCTPTARHQMILSRDPRVEAAMDDLRRALARTGVVLVDHRDPPSGCACDGLQNPLLAEFRRADDFANRAVFHPCRMEWEQACIDPDGTVHPVDYSRPPIGNLLHTSLAEMWNGPDMASLRRAALHRTPKRLRTSCPLT